MNHPSPQDDRAREFYKPVLMLVEVKNKHLNYYQASDDNYMLLVFDKTKEGEDERLKVLKEFNTHNGTALDTDSFMDFSFDPHENLHHESEASMLAENYHALYLPISTPEGTEYPQINTLRRLGRPVHLNKDKTKEDNSPSAAEGGEPKPLTYRDHLESLRQHVEGNDLPRDKENGEKLHRYALPIHYLKTDAPHYMPQVVSYLRAREDALHLKFEPEVTTELAHGDEYVAAELPKTINKANIVNAPEVIALAKEAAAQAGRAS